MIIRSVSSIISSLITLNAFLILKAHGLSKSLDSSTAAKICGARRLGGSDLIVSEACLGTMTFGVQNSQAEAFEQLDYARSVGVNFIDTAEMYPVPMTAPDWIPGSTEAIVGNYLSKIGSVQRDDLVVATKITGYMTNSFVAAVRTAPPAGKPFPDCRLDAESIHTACTASLRRLQTDRIDLMQIHWPDRYLPSFGQTEFKSELIRDDSIPIEETAAALRDLIEAGKIRYIGLSNESPLGVCEWVKATTDLGIRDRLVSIQNSYSLLDRRFDGDLAEVCNFHNIGLLPWSILAGGLLSGKYSKGQTAPPGSRFVKYPAYMRRWSPVTASEATLDAVERYAKIAKENAISLADLAISFARTRPFISEMGSVIVGATTMEQLKENLSQFDGNLPVKLSGDVLSAINEVHMTCRDPSCYL